MLFRTLFTGLVAAGAGAGAAIAQWTPSPQLHHSVPTHERDVDRPHDPKCPDGYHFEHGRHICDSGHSPQLEREIKDREVERQKSDYYRKEHVKREHEDAKAHAPHPDHP